MADTAWIPYGILFQEFHEFRPRLVVTRVSNNGWRDVSRVESMIKILWTVATFLLMASYAGNLKSNLIIQRYKDTFDDLKQMIEA